MGEAREASRQRLIEGSQAKESAAEANKQKHKQSEHGPGPTGQLFSDVKKIMEANEAEAKGARPSGPLAKMFEKTEEAKAAKHAAEQLGKDEAGPSAGLVDKLKKGRAPAAVKLYGDAQIRKPTNAETISPALGAMVCAASIAAIAMFVASRRARTLTSDHYQLNVQPDLEQTVE